MRTTKIVKNVSGQHITTVPKELIEKFGIDVNTTKLLWFAKKGQLVCYLINNDFDEFFANQASIDFKIVDYERFSEMLEKMEHIFEKYGDSISIEEPTLEIG